METAPFTGNLFAVLTIVVAPGDSDQRLVRAAPGNG
jgi:hypothetical protein